MLKSSTGNLAACLDRMSRGRAFREALMGNGSDAQVPYAQPLLDAVELFERLQIGYALVGSVAAMYYGRARFTEDLDFVAASGHQEVLTKNPDVMRANHFDPSCTWKLYHESGVEIDIGKDEHAHSIVQRARPVQLAGRTVQIAEVNDLVAMKLRAGRLQDDYDVSEMFRAGRIDEARVQSLVSVDEFAHFLEIKSRT
jgi:hypothetical protein